MTENDKQSSQQAQPPHPHPYPPYDPEEDEISLIDLIYPLFKRRRFLVLFVLFAVVVAGLIIIRTPKTYEAKAMIMPESPEDASASGELKAAFMEQFGIAGLGGSTPTPSLMFEAILNSKDLAHAVLKRSGGFFVQGVADKDQDKACQTLIDAVQVSKSRDQPTISIQTQGPNSVWAADLANSYVLALDAYNRENTVTSARRLRKYIEQRLQAASRELEESQRDLRSFQEEHHAVSISKQAEATLDVLSEMEARRVELEVQMAAKEKFYKGSHIEIEQTKAQMEALQRNIDRLTYSEVPEVALQREQGRVEFYIPLTRIPALNFDESRLLLDVKSKTQVVSMLITQLEQAKLDETKDMPTINVLDQAVPPMQAAKPKIMITLVLTMVVAFFIGVFLVYLMEFSRRMEQDPEASPKWKEIKSSLRPFKKK